MPHTLRINSFVNDADRGRANQWFADVNNALTQQTKLIHQLTDNKIDSEPDRLVVQHVSIFQHFADPSEDQLLTANEPIMPLGENLPVHADGDVFMTAIPTISAPDRSGQILFMHNTGTSTISLQDASILPGSNLRLHGQYLYLGANEAAIFMEVSGEWVLHGYAVSSPNFSSLHVGPGNAIFTGFIYQTNAAKAVDMQNMILRGTATVFDREGFRNAISAAVQNHVHDFTASGSVPYSYVIPGAFEGLDDDGNPIFGAPSTVNVNIPFTVTGTTGLERLP